MTSSGDVTDVTSRAYDVPEDEDEEDEEGEECCHIVHRAQHYYELVAESRQETHELQYPKKSESTEN